MESLLFSPLVVSFYYNVKIVRNVNLQDIFEKLTLFFLKMIVTPQDLSAYENVRECWIFDE